MYRFLVRPRWIGFALLVILTMLACLLLARWQLHRLDTREARNAVVHQNIDQPAIAVGDLLVPDEPLPANDQWRKVTVSGTYDDDSTLLVRKRTQKGTPGLFVLTPIRDANGVGLWINRGWVEAGGTATSTVTPPAPPEGKVTVTARLRTPEPPSGRSTAGVPEGQIDRIDVPTISDDLSYPVYGGYGEVIEEQPSAAVAPDPVDPPDLGDGPHLSYAVQWATFAVVAIVGWYVLIRKEAERLAEERQSVAAAAGPDPEPDLEPVQGDRPTRSDPRH